MVTRRYIAPFKLKILTALYSGKYTEGQLWKLYSIAPATMNEWIRKYEHHGLTNSRVIVETRGEITGVKAL